MNVTDCEEGVQKQTNKLLNAQKKQRNGEHFPGLCKITLFAKLDVQFSHNFYNSRIMQDDKGFQGTACAE